jgi:hypothetical protein
MYVRAEEGKSRWCARAVYNHRKFIAYLLRAKKKIKGKIIDCVAISYRLSAYNKLKNTRHLIFVKSFSEIDNDREI